MRTVNYQMLALFFCLVAGSQPLSAQAPTIAVTSNGEFNESYIDRPVIAGNLLVGLHWKTAERGFDPTGLAVQPARDGNTSLVCASVASEDGRYSSTNLFRLPGNAGSLTVLKNGSTARMLSVQNGYPVARMGVLVRQAVSCDDPAPGPVLPVTLLPQGGTASALIVKVNATAADASVSLSRAGIDIAKDVKCAPAPAGVRIAFGAECTIEMPGPRMPGDYVLTVRIAELFSAAERKFPVLIQQ